MSSRPKTYVVSVPEVWYQAIAVVAKSKKDAINKVKKTEGQMLDSSLEYSHTLEEHECKWYAEEAE